MGGAESLLPFYIFNVGTGTNLPSFVLIDFIKKSEHKNIVKRLT